MGVIIYPGEIGSKMDNMDIQLNNLETEISTLESKMNEILSNIGEAKKLTGEAWTNQSNHIRNVQMWILHGWREWIIMQKEAN